MASAVKKEKVPSLERLGGTGSRYVPPTAPGVSRGRRQGQGRGKLAVRGGLQGFFALASGSALLARGYWGVGSPGAPFQLEHGALEDTGGQLREGVPASGFRGTWVALLKALGNASTE